MKTEFPKEWSLIKILDWKNQSDDHEAIARRCIKLVGEDGWRELSGFVDKKVGELQQTIREYEKMGSLDIGSDDGFSDVCYHIIGLGKEEFEKCCQSPKLAEQRYNSPYGTPDGYKESFAYVFLEPTPERTPEDTKIDLEKMVKLSYELINQIASISRAVECIQSEMLDLSYRIAAVKGDLNK